MAITLRSLIRRVTPRWFRVGAATVAVWAARLVAPCLGLAVICWTAMAERRKPRRERPAIFWGVTPLINIKFQSRAVSLLGYESKTVVRGVYAMHRRSDFDYLMSDILDLSPWMRRLPDYLKAPFEDYWTFAWALRHFDIFSFYFDSTILRHTPWKHAELQLLKFAGKKSLFCAYGLDAQVISRFQNLLHKHAHNMEYAAQVRGEYEVLRDIDYCSRHADYIIGGCDWVYSMPRWDRLVAGHFAIDVEEWQPAPVGDATGGRPVVVLHAPNHRETKGSRFLIRACEELKAEGVPVELVLAEKIPNTRVHELLRDCDIVADQFVIGWYAQFAIEGMSMEKPVMTYLRPDLLQLYTLNSYAGECPIVNTPPTEIKRVLRELIDSPQLRRDLGKKGRAYVRKYHSLESVGGMFDEVFRVLWGGEGRRAALGDAAAHDAADERDAVAEREAV
jgi:glycosyltransferase involved in cell wall biosynthesis